MTKLRSMSKVNKKIKTPNWENAIKYAEKLIRETKDKERKYRLKLAIEWFEFLIEVGEPWPGSKRKKKSGEKKCIYGGQ